MRSGFKELLSGGGGGVGIKIYNLRKLIFKGPIFYLKP